MLGGRGTLYRFEYFEPPSVAEALQILEEYSHEAKVLAGGVDLIPRMRSGEIKPNYVVNISRIEDLDHMASKGEKGLVIGSLIRLRALERSDVIRREYTALTEAIQAIASIQVKTMATAAGNICVGTPGSDLAPALLAVGARCRIVGKNGERVVPIEDFFQAYHQTAVHPVEIVTELSVPSAGPGAASAFLRVARTATDVSKVSVAVMLSMDGPVCREARIGLGSVAPTPIRAKRAERMLKGQRPEPEAIERAAAAARKEVKPISDIRSSSEYRAEITEILVRRTIQKALESVKR